MTTLNYDPKLAAFLDLIAASEGTSTSTITKNNGYDVIVTGVDGQNRFDDYSCHPFAHGRTPILVRAARPAAWPADAIAVPALHSTASGRYQFELGTWTSLAHTFGFDIFSPANQDMAAVELLDECHASPLIENGDVELAIHACSTTWASFPGNAYGQGGRSMEWLLAKYNSLLGGA